MNTKTTVKYALHFQYYKYNTGAADNGSFIGHLVYDSLEEAEKSWNNLEEKIAESETSKILDDLLAVDGYIEELLAIFKIETVKSYDDHGLFEIKKIETRIRL